jgi:hypothetical protein
VYRDRFFVQGDSTAKRLTLYTGQITPTLPPCRPIPTLLEAIARGFAFLFLKNVMCRCQNVSGQCPRSCLPRPQNSLVRQLNDEPKLVYKVGFISDKGKATARALQGSPEASNSLLM